MNFLIKVVRSALISLVVLMVLPMSADAYVSVKGYTRKNGTYVAPYVRSNPNGLKYDNYSYKPSQGLYNPSYGTKGTTWDTPTYITDPDYYIGKSLYDSKSTGASSLYKLPTYIPTYTPTYIPSYTTPTLPSYVTPSVPTYTSPSDRASNTTAMQNGVCAGNAAFDIATGACKCLHGYFGDSCMAGAEYCVQKHGSTFQYDYPSDQCVCKTGYIKNSSGQCVSQADSCLKYGANIYYDTVTRQCTCNSGYFFDEDVSGCVDGNTVCRKSYGANAGYNSLSNKCETCASGYTYSNGSCLPVQKNAVAEKQICGRGFVMNSKGNCLPVPVNAHAVTGSKTDLWVCNDGYIEIGNGCYTIK